MVSCRGTTRARVDVGSFVDECRRTLVSPPCLLDGLLGFSICGAVQYPSGAATDVGCGASSVLTGLPCGVADRLIPFVAHWLLRCSASALAKHRRPDVARVEGTRQKRRPPFLIEVECSCVRIISSRGAYFRYWTMVRAVVF